MTDTGDPDPTAEMFDERPWQEYETELDEADALVGLEERLFEEYDDAVSGAPLDGDRPVSKDTEEGSYLVDVTYTIGDGEDVRAEVEVEEDDGDYELVVRTAPGEQAVESVVRDYIETDVETVERNGVAYAAEPDERPLTEVVPDRGRVSGLESTLDEDYDRVEVVAPDGKDRPEIGWQDDTEVLEDGVIEVYDGDSVVEVAVEGKRHLIEYTEIQVDGEDTEMKQEVMEVVSDHLEEFEDIDNHEYREEMDYDLAWDDVGGLEEQKQVLKENVMWPMVRPDLFDDEQRSNGILLHGPPGTGKTMLAKTLVSEMDDSLDEEVGLYIGDPNSLGSKYVSENAENVYKLFDEAKSGSPSVVFIDELDSIASQRMDGDSSAEQERNDQINAVLQNMDGVEHLEDVVVIGTTNRPDNVDDAALRGGRFDEQHEVPMPGEEAREQIWEIHTSDDAVEYGDLDHDSLVERSEGLPGSDIEAASRKAYRIALRDAVEDAGGIRDVAEDDIVVDQDHLEDALDAFTEDGEDLDEGRTGFA